MNIDRYVAKIYEGYTKEIKKITAQAFTLNGEKAFRSTIFTTSAFLPSHAPPSKVIIAFLQPHHERLAPVVKEQAQVHSWLLRISNRMYDPSLVYRLLPQVILDTQAPTEPRHSSEADRCVLRKAKLDPEFTLIKRRLLLRTME